MDEEKRPLTVAERFRILDEKKRSAADAEKERLKAIKAEYRKKIGENNVLARWNAFFGGGSADNYTEYEIQLLASVDDPSLLALDEQGHLCLLSDLNKQAAEASVVASEEKTTIEEAEAEAETKADLTQAAALRKNALHNSRVFANKDLQLDDESAEVLESLGYKEAQDVIAPVMEKEGNAPEVEGEDMNHIDDDIPVNEAVRVLRIEDIGFGEARIYLSVAENKLTGEQSYGAYLEQGYGQSRSVFVCGERCFGVSQNTMVFRAAAALLNRYTIRGQAINDVTIFVESKFGWELSQNSWALVTDAFNIDADLYSQTFRACTGNQVKVRIASSEAHCVGQDLARRIAEEIVKTPQ